MKTQGIHVLGSLLTILVVGGCSSSSDTGGGPSSVVGTGGAANGNGGGQGGSAAGGSGQNGGSVNGGANSNGGVAGTTGGANGSGGTACPTAPSSGGAGGSDTGSAKDVGGSAECTAWCDALHAACPSVTCDPSFDCAIKTGECAASEKAFLDCQVQTGQFYCGSDGYSVIHSCHRDPSLCSGGGGGGPSKPTCQGMPATAPSGGSCYQAEACNPMTNEGCPDNAACDLSDNGFACFDVGAVDHCGACDPLSGPFCKKGDTCLGAECARYCCTDADCGCGKCSPVQQGSTLIHVCLN